MKSTLSVCIISKNEEKNIKRCITSVSDLADEIVVVDTGSTDNTVDIAKSLGAKVINHKWNNDFSEARNISLDNANMDWVLVLDCDEMLPKEEGEKLKLIISDDINVEKYEAFYLRLVNIISDKKISDDIVLRVFKNKPEYRFRFKLHEQIINSIQENKGINSIAPTSIEIYHYGYDTELYDMNKKSKRNLEILLSYDDSKKDGYYYYVLGNEYVRIKEYDKALDEYRKALDKSKIKTYRDVYCPYLAIKMTTIYYTQGKYYDCIDAIDKFKKIFVNFKDLYFIECLSYIAQYKISKASEALDKYLNCPIGKYQYPSNKYENINDIPELVTKLNDNIVPHRENMLTSWILMKEWDNNVIETIKSLNEISEEIIIITTENNEKLIDKIKQIGGKVLTMSLRKFNRFYKSAISLSHCEYILLVYSNEICPHISRIKLANLLNSDDIDEAYLIRIVEGQSQNYNLRLSLFKRDKRVSSIEEYINVITEKGITPYDVDISIYSNNYS